MMRVWWVAVALAMILDARGFHFFGGRGTGAGAGGSGGDTASVYTQDGNISERTITYADIVLRGSKRWATLTLRGDGGDASSVLKLEDNTSDIQMYTARGNFYLWSSATQTEEVKFFTPTRKLVVANNFATLGDIYDSTNTRGNPGDVLVKTASGQEWHPRCIQMRTTGRLYMYKNNRWVTYHANYGYGYYQINTNAGTGAKPSPGWIHTGGLVSGVRITGFTMMSSGGHQEIKDLEFALYANCPKSGHSWEDGISANSELEYHEIVPPTGLKKSGVPNLKKDTMLHIDIDYTVPKGTWCRIVPYWRPVGSLSDNRFLYGEMIIYGEIL